MTSCMRKTTFREIRSSIGRFMAIVAIIALGVGFFAGLKTTTTDMLAVADGYLADANFYDYRILSTLGFTEEQLSLMRDSMFSVVGVNGSESFSTCEGAVYTDAIFYDAEQAEEKVVKVHSITKEVNRLNLVAGRMPVSSNECVVDALMYGEDVIGDVLQVADSNDSETADKLAYREYTVVGLVTSPLYLNFERGTTALLNGTVAGFMYIPFEGFAVDYYTELYGVLNNGEEIYTDAYESRIENFEECVVALSETLADSRVDEIYESMKEALRQEWPEVPEELLPEITKPECTTYVLTREANVGYVCFENDAHIVEGIATVFPVFFILVAALVCMTTMNRMVEEQRTQIGVLKALGYSAGSIAAKYITYSGLAAVIGCVGGFFGGCYLFPTVIWKVYGIMYDFSAELIYCFELKYFLISFAVSILCSVGATCFSIFREMTEVPAELIRPRAPKNGKRIWLERVPLVWNRMSFLLKVSFRNVVRYRKRFFMMIVGIAGCTALLVTGYGIRDSIVTLPKVQYGEILDYDYFIRIEETEEARGQFEENTAELLTGACFVESSSVEVWANDVTKTAGLIVPEKTEALYEYVHLRNDDGDIELPGTGQVLINEKLADQLGLSIGDMITVHDGVGADWSVTVGGIFENYVSNYLFMTEDTYKQFSGREPEYLYAYANMKDGDDVYNIGAELMTVDGVSNVDITAESLERFDTMFSSIDYIVILVIGCAAALAFVVLYNLTNINITERIREIATIKVLGFYSKETSLYVFRENLMLTAIGAVVGLPLGVWLHRFVMSKIQVDIVYFRINILWQSYVYSLLFTFLFAILVDVFMHFKLEKINMAESMKSIE